MLPDPVEAVDLNIYGDAKLPWSRAREALKDLPRPETPVFLGTAGPDGRPPSAGAGCIEYNGAVFFTSGPKTRKSRNLAANPACTLSARLPGVDLVMNGRARRVTEPYGQGRRRDGCPRHGGRVRATRRARQHCRPGPTLTDAAAWASAEVRQGWASLTPLRRNAPRGRRGGTDRVPGGRHGPFRDRGVSASRQRRCDAVNSGASGQHR